MFAMSHYLGGLWAVETGAYFPMSRVKSLLLLLMSFLGLINRCLPKFNIIVFFTNNQESNDNNLALLIQMVEFGIDKRHRIYFFSRDGKKYAYFKRVKYKSVGWAPLYFLFAKYCFYDCGTLKIKPSANQCVISLWHGIPLKRVGLMLNERASRFDRYNDFSKILVPSEQWKEVYKSCFGCTDNQVLIQGFPRNDFLFRPNFDKLAALGIMNGYAKYILWMPTFRRSIGGRYVDVKKDGWDLPIFSRETDLSNLNERLLQLNVLLVVKVHPYSTLNRCIPFDFSNIVFIRNADLNTAGIVNYEFVSCFDALITDYSSILFDYLLTNRPIAFTIDDIEVYQLGRGFTVYDPEKYLVGRKIRGADEFFKFILSVVEGKDPFLLARSEIRDQVHKYVDDKSGQRLLKEIHLL